jgi:type IV pilus assembly protein PilB
MSVLGKSISQNPPGNTSSVNVLTELPIDIPSELRGIMSDQIMRRYQMAIFGRAENSALKVAMADPNDIDALNVLHFLAEKQGVSIETYQASQDILDKVIVFCGQPDGSIRDAISSFSDDSSSSRPVIVSQTPLSTKDSVALTPPASSPTEGAAEQPMIKTDTAPVKAPETSAVNELMRTGMLTDQSLQDTSVARLVQVLVEHALEARASDIHIEPIDKNYRVRFRVDGTLQTALVLPIEIGRSVVARIKILSSLKIDEKRKPQDGRFRVDYKARSVDLRVSTFPVVEGEKVVLRILDTSRGMEDLHSLGLDGRNHEVLTRKIKEPFGIILITGPTGSGKSTTLYAFLKLLNNQERNIVTLEDPVEYFLNGINQSQVRPEIGYTFANGLRSILRQDPNVIMVGEIRDEETAELSIHAALTGHLVFSTLHTNTATGAIPRLIDMGIEPFLLSSSLQLVMAQRLIRRVCSSCTQEITLTKKAKESIESLLENVLPSEFEQYNLKCDANGKPILKFVQGTGCEQCHKTGYSGRIAIMEVLEVTDKIQEAIVDHRGSEAKVIEEATAQHMLSMRQDGVLKALRGLTTLVEVERATSGSSDLLEGDEEQVVKTPVPVIEDISEETDSDDKNVVSELES